MSYCRFSSDDFRCDVYVYEDAYGGWVTHVAGRRHVIDEDALPPPVEWIPGDEDSVHRWFERYRQVSKLIDGAELVDIGLPHDGASFNDPTPGACADRLEQLRELGYRVPDRAIKRLREEEAG